MTNAIRHLDFYICGSFSTKTDMGGWAAICVEDGLIIDVQEGFEAFSTTNRLNLKSFNSVLNTISQIISKEHTEIYVYTPNSYVVNTYNGWYRSWINNGWKTADGQEIKNQDLLADGVAMYIKYAQRFYDFNIIKQDSDENEYSKYVKKLAIKQKRLLEEEK